MSDDVNSTVNEEQNGQQGAGDPPWLKERLSRLEKKHAKELETTSQNSIKKFREANGLTDDLLQRHGASSFMDFHRRIVELEEENRRLGEFEKTVLAEKEWATVSSFLQRETPFECISDEAKDFVEGKLRQAFTVGEDGQVTLRDGQGDPKTEANKLLTRMNFALKPRGNPAGAGSRAYPQAQPKSQEIDSLTGLPRLSPEEGRRQIVEHALGLRKEI